MPDEPAPLLRLIGITRRFGGVVALKRVSFDLAAGEVHALVGENGAGKSTLINILSGVLASDEGMIELAGRPVVFANPVEARRAGIATVHQEAELFGTLSVAENMALEQGLPTRRGGWIRWAEVSGHARRAVALVGETIDVRAPAACLSIAQRHMIQIAAAVTRRARVLVLDEPTSALSAAETAWLLGQLERLQQTGVGIIYISHRHDEILQLADRITVLRDGHRVWTGRRDEVDRQQLVRHMVGRPSPPTTPIPVSERPRTGAARLEVRQLTAADGRFADISLAAHAGEIVGVYGLVGSGRSEFARAVFGLEPPAGGSILVDGRPRAIRTARQAVSAGLAYLPEDRLSQAVFRGLSLRANTVLASLRMLAVGPLASARRERDATRRQAESLAIKCRGVEQPLAELSGGNQQKAVLGRWLLTQPGVLLLDEPTRGVDVASKAEIHRILRELAGRGTSIVMISSELEEVLAHCDRIVVFRAGRLAAEFASADATPEKVAAAALPDSDVKRPAGTFRAAGRARPRRIPSEAALALAVTALALTLALSTDTFLSSDNLWRLLASAAVWCILSLGAAAVIIAGGIDISIGSLLALSAGVGGLTMQAPYPAAVTIPLGILAALATGTAGGLCNAALTLAGRVHPIVITLGTMTIYRGLLIALSGGETIGQLPPAFVAWSNARLGGINAAAALGAAAALAVYVWLAHLRSGRHLVALGSSAAAARLVGISRWRTWLAAFGAGGLLAALAGLVELSQTGSMQSGMGSGYELHAIAAAVIGGVSITGGRGSVLGVCLGALMLSLIYNALVLWQVSGYHYALVSGLLLLLAVLADLAWRRFER